jgi:hypothetical protein
MTAQEGSGFDVDTNAVDPGLPGGVHPLRLMSKQELAGRISISSPALKAMGLPREPSPVKLFVALLCSDSALVAPVSETSLASLTPSMRRASSCRGT